jgi:hypothetical protein
MGRKRKWRASFDPLVGTGKERCWRWPIKRLAGLDVDHEFGLDRNLDRKTLAARPLSAPALSIFSSASYKDVERVGVLKSHSLTVANVP